MSHRKMSMFTIRTCGEERLCVQTANGQRFANYATAVFGTRCDYITKKAGFSVGGIIGCFRFRKIADYVSMQFWRVKRWRRDARQRGSIGKCVREKNLRIMPRSGQNLNRWIEQSLARCKIWRQRRKLIASRAERTIHLRDATPTHEDSSPRYKSAVKAAHDLGRRMSFLQALDRTLARNHRGRS